MNGTVPGHLRPRRNSCFKWEKKFAAAETVMGLFKIEAIRNGSPFRIGALRGLADVEEVTFDWVNWYNNERLHSFLGDIPPEEFEANYYAGQTGPSADGAANKTAA